MATVSPEEKELMRWVLSWKRNWDETGFPPVGTMVNVTSVDLGLYRAVQAYERAAVERAMKSE